MTTDEYIEYYNKIEVFINSKNHKDLTQDLLAIHQCDIKDIDVFREICNEMFSYGFFEGYKFGQIRSEKEKL